MKNVFLGAIVFVAVYASSANASLPAGYTTANTVKVFLSGASAPRAFIESLITRTAGGICSGGFYKWADSSSNNQNAYACKIDPASTLRTQLNSAGFSAKINLLLYKRSAGGSGQGVVPLFDQTPISFMDVENTNPLCAAPALNGTKDTCTVTQNQIPQFGVSDVDPIHFGLTKDQVNGPTGLDVKPAFAQIFGIPVSLKLYRALQTAQFPATTSKCNPLNAGYNTNTAPSLAAGLPKIKFGESAACMPSLSTHQISSILTGKLTSWSQLYVSTEGLGGPGKPLTAAPGVVPPGNPAVHICSRVNTSGTYAATNIKLLNYPCNDEATPPALDNGSFGNGALFNPETFGTTQVHQLSSGGVVNECFDELDKGINTTGTSFNNLYTTPRWAIGIQGTDNNANQAFNYRFVKIDNIVPSAQNVVNGRYRDWVESTYQFKKGVTLSNDVKLTANFIISQSGKGTIIGALNNSGVGCTTAASAYVGQTVHCWGASGFLASPAVSGNSASAAGNVAIRSANPVNPLSHDTPSSSTAVNNCRVPALYNSGTAAAQKGLQFH